MGITGWGKRCREEQGQKSGLSIIDAVIRDTKHALFYYIKLSKVTGKRVRQEAN